MLDGPLPIDDSFPDEQLASIKVSHSTPWYANYANYTVAKYLPPSFTYQQKKKFFYDLRHYFWDDPHLYKGVDGIIRCCVPEHEQGPILRKCHVRTPTRCHIDLYNEGVDGIIRRCVPEHEQGRILLKCHSVAYGGHHAGDRTAHKVLQSRFYWPTLIKDARKFVLSCD